MDGGLFTNQQQEVHIMSSITAEQARNIVFSMRNTRMLGCSVFVMSERLALLLPHYCPEMTADPEQAARGIIDEVWVGYYGDNPGATLHEDVKLFQEHGNAHHWPGERIRHMIAKHLG